MSFERCIQEALGGKLGRNVAERLAERRDSFKNAGFADAIAEQKALDAEIAEMSQQKLQTMLQTVRVAEAADNVTAHPKGVRTGVMSILGRDITGQAKYSNIDFRAKAVMSQFTSKVSEGMEALRTTAFGFRQNTDLARDVVRQLFGGSTGNGKAARIAKAFGEAFEDARVRFNAAGGRIAKRDDWGMPQFHDFRRVASTPQSQWKTFIAPRLDRTKMLDDAGAPLTDEAFNRLLDEVYETVSTDGLNKLVPGQAGGQKLANRHNDRRHLIFKDGDAWLEYHDQFGRQNLYVSMMDHLESMAHEIANLEILGPNPAAAYRHLRDLARKDGTGGVALSTMDALYRTVSGAGSDTVSTRLGDTSAAVRNYLTSVRLGSAMLSAVSDLAFVRQAAKWNDLSSTRIMRNMISNLNPANAADRLKAVEMGLHADAWMSHALAANRFTEVTGAGFSAKAADTVMRLSGLSAWTDAGQKAVGQEVMTVLGENLGKNIDQLPNELQAGLRQYVTEEDWAIIRSTDPEKFRGVSAVSPRNILARTDIQSVRARAAASHLLEYMHWVTNQAVPTPDARARAITTGGLQAGTVGGELLRFGFQFKSFPVSVVLQHVYQGIYRGSALSRASYLGGLAVATTVMGALAMQLKEISKGRDPRGMDSPEFWGAAFLQGGGAGILGDFINAGVFGTNRFGNSLLATLGGPTASAVEDGLRLTVGQAGEAASGDDLNLGRDAAFALSRYTPGASSLWYMRIAFERMVVDQLALEADPDAPARFRRERRRLAREQGQEFWWRRGQLTPDRAPDLGAAVEDD